MTPLMEATAAGAALRLREPQAMTEIYRRLGRLVFSVIQGIVRDTSTAEELAQDTFIRVWNGSPAFDGSDDSLMRWVMVIARNRAIDHVRSRRWRMEKRTSALGAREYTAAALIDTEGDAVRAQHARIVREALAALTPNQREVIRLAYYEGLSQSQIAARMGQPLGTVKSWARAALKLLRGRVDGIRV